MSCSWLKGEGRNVSDTSCVLFHIFLCPFKILFYSYCVSSVCGYCLLWSSISQRTSASVALGTSLQMLVPLNCYFKAHLYEFIFPKHLETCANLDVQRSFQNGKLTMRSGGWMLDSKAPSTNLLWMLLVWWRAVPAVELGSLVYLCMDFPLSHPLHPLLFGDRERVSKKRLSSACLFSEWLYSQA